MHQEEKLTTSNGTSISLGLVLGLGIGAALKDLSIGVAVGLTLGSALGFSSRHTKRKEAGFMLIVALLALAIVVSNRVL